ncbi:MAG: hypothetical protein ABIE03_05360 [Patescibacteria group bacterium]|nr:hypothetical protein [Patescibacteria group bacterium]
MTKLYHIFREDLKGTTLYPLNLLKKIYPSVYKNQVKKYEGREELMKRMIPILSCLWNDVIHLCPVHPSKIKDAFLEAGCEYKEMSYWVIDPKSLKSKDTVIFLYTTDEGYIEEDFVPFSDKLLEKYSEVPAASKNYFRKCAAEKRKPLFFHRVPHVLYKGIIKVGNLEVITA